MNDAEDHSVLMETPAKQVTCPRCQRPFVLHWTNDRLKEDPRAAELNGTERHPSGRIVPRITLDVWSYDWVTGGIHDVKIRCPHCGYEEEL